MNYYELLGIDRKASLEDIKKSFRKLIKKKHPDRTTDDTEARNLIDIYEVLKDPEKRKKYDTTIATPTEQLPKKGVDLQVSLRVTSDDLISEAEKNIKFKRKGLCRTCLGTQSLDKKKKKCVYCNGTGWQGMSIILKDKKNCIYCHGKGSQPEGPHCRLCSDGRISEEIKTKIKLNPLDRTLVIKGLGNYGLDCEAPGDLIITLDVLQNPLYFLNDRDIKTELNISPAQAILGDTVKLRLLGKKVELEIPSGILDNTVLKNEKKGINYKGFTGDWYVKIHIVIPKIITSEEKELYLKILTLEKEEPCLKILQ